MKALEWLNEIKSDYKHDVLVSTVKNGKVKSVLHQVTYLEDVFFLTKELSELQKSNCLFDMHLKQLKAYKTLNVGYDENVRIVISLISDV